MPLEADSSNLAEQRSYLQSFKAPLLEGECLGIIVSVVTEPLSAHPDMGEEDAQTVQLVLTLFRNLLRITDAVPTAASGSHHRTRMREIMIQRFFDERMPDVNVRKQIMLRTTLPQVPRPDGIGSPLTPESNKSRGAPGKI